MILGLVVWLETDWLVLFSACLSPLLVPFASSSVEIAAEVKMLDMSLPSYGDIKESTASVATVKSLTVDTKGQPVGIVSKRKSAPAPAPAPTKAAPKPMFSAPAPAPVKMAEYEF